MKNIRSKANSKVLWVVLRRPPETRNPVNVVLCSPVRARITAPKAEAAGASTHTVNVGELVDSAIERTFRRSPPVPSGTPVAGSVDAPDITRTWSLRTQDREIRTEAAAGRRRSMVSCRNRKWTASVHARLQLLHWTVCPARPRPLFVVL